MSLPIEPLFVAHLFATLMMTGVIWFVQVVHYPLMAAVAPTVFREYEARHVRLTTRVVAPLMLVELGTAVLVTAHGLASDLPLAAAGNAGLLAVIWLSTALVMVPAHRRLENGFQESVHRRLVAANWVRTVAWSGRVLLLAILAPAFLT